MPPSSTDHPHHPVHVKITLDRQIEIHVQAYLNLCSIVKNGQRHRWRYNTGAIEMMKMLSVMIVMIVVSSVIELLAKSNAMHRYSIPSYIIVCLCSDSHIQCYRQADVGCCCHYLILVVGGVLVAVEAVIAAGEEREKTHQKLSTFSLELNNTILCG